MSNTQNRELKIDAQFRDLIPPLTEEERKQLEDNLIAEGCRDPICIWNGIILDGHNRYEICMRRGISFTVKDIQCQNRSAAISWICANQLGRRNISEETRRYLKSAPAAFVFVEQYLVHNNRSFRKHDLYSFLVTGNPQRSLSVGKKGNLVRIIFRNVFVNYGKPQIIRDQTLYIHA